MKHEIVRKAVERGKWRTGAAVVVVAAACLLLRLIDKQHLERTTANCRTGVATAPSSSP